MHDCFPQKARAPQRPQLAAPTQAISKRWRSCQPILARHHRVPPIRMDRFRDL